MESPLPIRIEYPVSEEPFRPLVELFTLDEIIKIIYQDMPDDPRVGSDDLPQRQARRPMNRCAEQQRRVDTALRGIGAAHVVQILT